MKKLIVVFFCILPCALFAQGWQDVGSGVRAITNTTATGVYTMCADALNHLLYVGGTFDSAGSAYSYNVAKWDGTNWYSMPTEQGPGVDAMIMYKGDLYVGGNNSNGVTKWDGTKWTILPLFNGGVYSLDVFNDTLYAGGSFTKSGNTTLNYIAKWDGTNWLPVGDGFNGYASPSVNAMCVWNGKLYAGGFFDKSGNSNDVYDIARWDDTAWNNLGKGIRGYDVSFGDSIDRPVYALDTFQNNLYVGGDFEFAGGDSTSNIAQWNGSDWAQVGQGVGYIVQSFKNYNNKLYAGGGINSWDGYNWDTVGSGINSVVYAIEVFDSQLYVGGVFTAAGNIPANYIARWSPDSTTTGGIANLSLKNNEVLVYPNPSSGTINIVSSKIIDELKVTNLLGQTVYETQPKQMQFTFQLKDEGMYFVTVTSENETQTKKVLVIK